MQLESIAMRKMVGMSPTEQGWHVTPSSFVPIERDEGKTRAPIAESDARVTLTMEAARAAFEEIDKNHDEELSQIEYIKALRRNPELAKRLGTNPNKSPEIVTLRARSLTFENVPGLPSEIRQEDEGRRLFQKTAFGAIDTDDSKTITDDSKTISWREFAAFYCAGCESAHVEQCDLYESRNTTYDAQLGLSLLPHTRL